MRVRGVDIPDDEQVRVIFDIHIRNSLPMTPALFEHNWFRLPEDVYNNFKNAMHNMEISGTWTEPANTLCGTIKDITTFLSIFVAPCDDVNVIENFCDTYEVNCVIRNKNCTKQYTRIERRTRVPWRF